MHVFVMQFNTRKFPKRFLSEIAAAVLDGHTGELLEYRHLMKIPKYKEIWGNSFENEVGQLAQGMPGSISKENATNTMFFIAQDEIPQERRRDAYARVVCNYRDQKKEKERTRIMMGGDRTNYPFYCGTPTAELLTLKLFLNSVISTMGA